MDTLLQDLRYGVRMLWKAPAFTVVAVVTLALGIGANTAIFSVVNAALLRPMPYRDSTRLMMLFHAYEKLNLPRATVSPLALDYYRQNVRSLEDLAAFTGYRGPENLTGSGTPEQVRSVLVSGSFFGVLGVEPMLGRAIAPADDQPGSNRVVVLSYALWKQRFAADYGVLGRDLTLDGNNYTIVGVMPQTFQYPQRAELWVPMGFTPPQWKDQMEFLMVIGRLKPGVSPGAAQAEMAKVSAEVLKIYPELGAVGWHGIAVPFREVQVGDIRPALLVLLGAVGFVLLIGCANIANLLLARSAARQKEIAIRAAMGASRGRVVRQLLTEGVLLSLIGGALGLMLGYWGLDVLLRLVPSSTRLAAFTVSIDRNVLLFTIGVSVVTGLIFASAPAIQSARTALADTLKEGGRTSAASGHHRLRSGLVIAEIALALVLLAGAGLMIRSFLRIQETDPGFDRHRVLTLELSLPQPKYQEKPRVAEFYRQLSERVSALPGVLASGLTSMLPLDNNWTNSFRIDGKPMTPPPHAHAAVASGEYFNAMRIPLRQGRFFGPADNASGPLVVVIDEALARAYFPNENPLGRRITLSDQKPEWREIVGVVGAVRHSDPLARETKGQLYLPYLQYPAPKMALAVRTAGDPVALAGAIRNQVLAIDSDQPIAEIKTMDTLLSEYVAQPRFNMVLLAVFAGLALLLAAVGIYGVIAYSVTQRTHEIGVRMALGARRQDVLRLVLSHAMRLAAAGLLIGLVGAFVATRVLSSMLYGIKSTDPVTFIAMSLLLGGMAALAGYLPARRAMRVDPMVALRYE